LHGKIVFPRVSTKTIGREAQRISTSMIRSVLGKPVDISFVESVADVEKVYHQTGVEVKGPVEMRTAWKYNDLKPRVYYAQGPDVYHRSKFIQPIFNDILDCFDVVHRFNRYELPEDRTLDHSDTLIIYDYSSFTSRLEEVLEFTRALADFYHDVDIVLVDTFTGPRKVSLRDLLLEYTAHCNESSVFDAARVFQAVEPFLVHHTAGMLGVPGNISSCTLLHGVHLCVLLSSCHRGRCVGDDALACLPNGIKESVRDAFIAGVNNLGDVEISKFSIWEFDDDPDESAWHFLKRPLTRVSAAIQKGEVLIWPSIANILSLEDEFHTVVRPTLLQRRKTFIAQWCRLLDRLHLLHSDTVTAQDIAILVWFQNGSFRRLELRNGGYVRFDDSRGQSLLVPRRMSTEDFHLDWRRYTFDWFRSSGEIIELPSSWELQERWFGYAEERFASRMTPILSLLERLGYLEKSIALEIVDFTTMDFDQCRRYLSLDFDFTYNFTVVKDFPDWANVVQYLVPMSPHERLSIIEAGNGL